MTIMVGGETSLTPDELRALIEARGAMSNAKDLLTTRTLEKPRLDRIHDYLRGKQPIIAAPTNAPDEVRKLARISRVNVIKIIVNSIVQDLYVDGYRVGTNSEEAEAWKVWQANGMDKRQIGVHRAALTYGVAYATVLPGDPVPVIRGYSPRRLTALYGADDQWPELALCVEPVGRSRSRYRLFDDRDVWTFEPGERGDLDLRLVSRQKHDAGVTPVIRFVNEEDLDEDLAGEVDESLMKLQDQIDLTTFELLVAQHYQSFRQRWIIGWTAKNEEELAKAGASKLWTFDEDPDKVKIGEFEALDLEGYLKSREDTLKHAATLSQTPVHELIGQLVNISAEALIAADAAHRRKITERQVSFGESWEQVLELVATLQGTETAENAEVRWRDTESRALSATVDALGKIASMLGVPVQELWERIPGATQQDVDRWKAARAADQTSEVTMLRTALAARAMTPAPSRPPAPTPPAQQ